MEQMKQLWQDIMAWFKDHAEQCYKDMLSITTGATDEQLHDLESVIGKTLPDDFKDYLRLYNKCYRVAFFEYTGVDTKRIVKNWKRLTELVKNGTFDTHQVFETTTGVRRVKWHPGWLPFAEDGGGNLICIDLAPPEGHEYGQVFYWENRGGPGDPIAPSFLTFVQWYRDELQSGGYAYDEASGIFEENI
ncbi:SMI1/KNR4 family protein [Desulfococcaceae bacterium HSG7]|nr:SMI1/KNR4 family protein [Desulfococcaceae bacterium HSG7]